MTGRWMLLAAPLLAVAAAGCSRSEPESPVEPANVGESATREATPSRIDAAPTATPSPVVAANASAELPPPPEPVAPDAQMLDDASATGMTARTQREAEPSDDPVPRNEAQ